MNILIKKIIYIFIILLSLSIFFVEKKWAGDNYNYLLFTISSFALAAYAIKIRPGAGFTFYAIAIFTGYWIKLSLHTIYSGLMWMEPTGAFNFTPLEWSEVSLVSTFGIVGTLIGGILGHVSINNKTVNLKLGVINFNNTKLIALCFISIFAVIFFNEYFNIIHAAITPHFINAPWPLQGIFNWYIAGPCFFIFTLPLWRSSKTNYFIPFACTFFLASAALSVSIFSRGIVFFQIVIIFLSFYCYKRDFPTLNKEKFFKILLVAAVCIALTAVLSGLRRELFIHSVVIKSQQVLVPTPQKTFSDIPLPSRYSLGLILKLPIERWIGLEGVMAVVGYPEKSLKLFCDAVAKKRALNEVDWYTSVIAKSPSTDVSKIMYATPPGLFAYSYYSGSYLMVFLIAFLASLIIVISEKFLYQLSKNPFLASSIGVGVAVQIIHIGSGSLHIAFIIFGLSMTYAVAISYFIGIKNN